MTENRLLAEIERRGLHIITWHGSSFKQYAVSVDATGDNPSMEQKRRCFWHDSPEIAAREYIKMFPA